MFGFLPHNLFTNHINQNTTGLSPRLWSRVSGTIMSSDGQKRLVLAGDDFYLMQGTLVTGSALTLPTVIGGDLSGYKAYIDTGGLVTPLNGTTDAWVSGTNDVSGGVVLLETDTSDNDVTIIGSNVLGGISPAGGTVNTGGTGNAMAFECRVRFPVIASQSSFIGLAEPNYMVADAGIIADDGNPIATTGCIGFSQRLSGTVIDFAYKTGGAATVTPAGADLCDTIVAGQFYKLGFIFDPDAPAEKRITVYVDNEEQTTYVTHALMDATAFPDSTELLGFVAAVCSTNGTSNDAQMEIDWWAYAGLID